MAETPFERLTVAGTGHRPPKLGGYGPEVYSDLIVLAHEWLEMNMPAAVISGMALGWDQALAVAAIGLQIPTIAAIPCDGQESRWPSSSQQKYIDILADCSEVKVVTPGTYTHACMQARNVWMVDNADVVLALWNGTSGGTANCIRYAESSRRPVINLWPEWAMKRVG